MRIRGAKTELEEAGESTEGMAESTASLREEILALSGVDIMQDANTFKSTYAIMDELADKWEGLSDIAQASITELIAGKHQGNVMSSLMANFDIARNALETSANSAGSAMAEHAKWSDSLEARLNKLKATWQSLSQSFMSSGFLKGGISAITGLVNGLDKLIDTFGAIPTILTAFTAFKSFGGGGFFKVIKDEATGAATGITNAFSQAAEITQNVFKNIGLKRESSFSAQIDTDIKALNKYIEKSYEFANLGKEIDEDTFKNIFEGASASAKQWASEGKLATQTVDDFVDSQKKLQVSTLAQNKSLGNASAIIKEYYDGCKNVGMGQEQFREAVSKTNPLLASQLTDANSAKSALLGYGASMVGATAKTIALTVATTALNAALTMGISALISWGISALDKWIVTADELAEKVDEVITKYKDQHSELMKLKGDYDTKNEDSLISKYEELSKGVDAFGRNLSLTADEYVEYQNIVKTIADQIPSLVSGYDSQGNAILSCAGDVKQLTAAYEELIKKQNDEVLINSSKDINKDFKNAVKDAEQNTEGWFGWNWTKNLNLGDSKLSTESAKVFENILNSTDAVSKFNKEFGKAESDMDAELLTDLEAMSDLLENAGFEKNGKWYNQESDIEHVRRAFEEDASKVKDILNSYYSDLEAEAEGKKQQAQAALSNALDLSDSMYYGMSDTMKNIARQTVSGFDFELFSKLEDQGISVEEYVNDVLDSLNSLSKTDKTSIEAAFDLRTKFNGGDISYGEYVNSIQEIGDLIDKSHLPNTAKDAIKNALNIDGIIEQYDALTKRLQDDFKWDEFKAKSFLDGLSAEEFAIAMEIIPELDAGATASDIQNMIDKEMAMRGLNVKLNIEVEKTNIEAVTTALSEMVTGAGMSSESISAVESMFKNMRGYDPSKLFERTANGIRLNREEFNKLNSEYSKTNLAELNKEMSSLGDIYNQTRKELYNLAYGTDEYNAKLAELDNIENQINSTEKLITQYKGLTSAYQQWQIAESSGNERDMYESVISGFNTVKDELSRGWADDGTREFMQLLRGETATIIDGKGQAKEINIATASAKELKQVWDDLDKTIEHTAEGGHKGYSLRDFFTTDKDGNATSKGVYNFLDAIGHMEEEVFGGVSELVERDDKGNIIGFNFDLVGGDEVIAEALGISEELVQIMVRAAGDAGFVVSFDGTYQQLDVLREKAQLAAESMNKILEKDGKKIEIDMNADTLEEIQPQIDSIMETFGAKDGSGKLTGAIDMSIEGAEDALTVVSTLQSMKDRLERPAYMNIQVNQVDDNLKEPLKNLQDYRTKIEQLNQAKLHGADTTELEASIKESKDKVVADLLEIQENNPELSGQLKIEGLSKEDIESKVEKGEITIPATVDIQLEMDEKLGILADKALLDAGIISKEEFTKRVEVYLDAEVNNNGTEEKVDNAVEEATGADEKPEPVKVIQPVEVNPELSEKSTWSKVKDWWKENVQSLYGAPSTTGVATGKDGRLAGMGAEPITVEQPVNVETGEIKTDGFFGKLWGNIKTLFTGGTVGIGDTGDGVSIGSDGQLKYRVGVKPEPEVNTEGVSEKVEQETKDAIENQSGETTTLEKDVQLEFNINDYVDELSKFKDVAKELEGLEDISVKINVNLEGELDSDKISSLKEFAEGAKELSGASDKDISVKANFEGNLSDAKGIDNLAQFAKGAKELNGAKSSEITITANFDGSYLDASSDSINNLLIFAEGAKELKGVEDIDLSVTANLEGSLGSWTGDIGDLTIFAEQAKKLQGVKDSDVTVNANIEGNITNESVARLESFANAIAKLPKSAVNISVKASVDTGSINNAIELLTKVANSGLFKNYDASVTVTYNKESGEVDNYNPEDFTRKVTYNLNSSEVDAFDPPNLHRTVYYHVVYLGGGAADGDPSTNNVLSGWINNRANGTAHANGTAFADGTSESGRAFKSGNWGTKESGIALMGELGRELIVRDGKFFTVGDEGAGLYPYKRGDIIFNHKQTEELFKNGIVTSNGGRGVLHGALANGTAFSSGTGGGLWNSNTSYKTESYGSTSSGVSGNAPSDDGEKENEILDWIEKLLERFDRAIDSLDKAANNIYKSFDKRNTSLSDEITKVNEQIANQKKAYERYIAEANTLGDDIGYKIGSDYEEKIRNGDFSIDVLSDEKLVEYIQAYEEWYEKALDCQDAIEELEETLSSLYALRVENVATKFEGILGVIEHEKSILEEYINQSEAQAWLVSSKYYDALASNERDTIAELQNQKAEMLIAFEEAMASGTIDEGSESW